MQANLHGRPARLLAIGVVALAIGCTRAESSKSRGGGASALTAVADASRAPSTDVLVTFARAGLDAARALVATCDDRAAYLSLRQSVVASGEAWRRSIAPAAEVAFGPEIAFDESGGALGILDRALTAHDCTAANAPLRQIEQALRLAEAEVTRRGIDPQLFAQALENDAYELGQALLESTPFVPDGDDAAHADVLGLLDAIEKGAPSIRLDVTAALAPFARVRDAAHLSSVGDRADLVRATGVLGAQLRHAAEAHGMDLRGPYVPRTSTDEISTFTLPRPAAPADPARAALGERLFSDPRLSRGGVRSCASCHIPARAYTDGLVAPLSLDPSTPLRRNTPTLLYAPLEALLTWDGRVRTADRQALMVLHAPAEMGLDEKTLTQTISSDPTYAVAFRAAFGHDVTANDIGLALAAFEARALVPDTAPIDRFGRGEDVLSVEAKAGLDVFAGKGRCARCHVPPLFGGSRPPDFTAPILSVIGVPTSPDAAVLDRDRGRGTVTGRPQDNGSFKVPTLRNVVRTAPYFHNGRYATLEQVVDFYDKGGGRGLGLPLGEQDPDVRPLNLSAAEKRALLAFLRDGLRDEP